MVLTSLTLLLSSMTATYGLPTGLLSALCFVESSHRPAVINPADKGSASLGLCQIKLKTAQSLGFKGTQEQLMEATTNAKYAAKYLKKQLKRYGGDTRKAVASYNSGTYIPSRIHSGFPANQVYVEKVFKAWSQKR